MQTRSPFTPPAYNYVLNGHNSIPFTAASTTTLPEGVLDLNGAVSINVETVPSETGLASPGSDAGTGSDLLLAHHGEDTNSASSSSSNASVANESMANTSVGSIPDQDYEGDDMEVDDDSEPELTNLSWLTELKNITNLTPSDVPQTDLPTARFNKFIAQVRR